MNAEQFLFWLFALLTCGGAIAVVLTQNIVRMAFYLIIALGSVAALFFLAGADFVGASQLIIYVGGTIILLIFGVMLTATGPKSKIVTSPAELLLAGGVGFLFLTMLIATVASVDWNGNRLKLVDITQIKFDEVKHAEAAAGHHDLLHLLDEHYYLEESRAVYRLKEKLPLHVKNNKSIVKPLPKYRLDGKPPLNSQEVAMLTELWHDNGLQFSPASAEGGTTRPLGLSFLGLRPDRNYLDPRYRNDNEYRPGKQGQQISPGFVTASREAAGGSNGELATGYLLPFEIVSIHLLVVLIGAAYLARAKKRVQETIS